MRLWVSKFVFASHFSFRVLLCCFKWLRWISRKIFAFVLQIAGYRKAKTFELIFMSSSKRTPTDNYFMSVLFRFRRVFVNPQWYPGTRPRRDAKSFLNYKFTRLTRERETRPWKRLVNLLDLRRERSGKSPQGGKAEESSAAGKLSFTF